MSHNPEAVIRHKASCVQTETVAALNSEHAGVQDFGWSYRVNATFRKSYVAIIRKYVSIKFMKSCLAFSSQLFRSS